MTFSVIEEPLRLHGTWTFSCFEGDVEYDEAGNPDRRPLWVVERDNGITTVGKQHALDRQFGLAAATALINTGVGTSGTAFSAGDTTLTGGFYKAFDALPVRTGLAVVATTTFGTADANFTWAEAALTTGAPGVLLNRVAPIGPFPKTSALSLAAQSTITQA